MIKMKWFTTKSYDVGKVPFDFCSFGHLIFGYSTYLIGYLIILLFELSEGYFFGMLLGVSITTSVFWEIIENFVLRVPRKFGKDTLQNSLADIVLTIIGATISHIFSFSFFSLVELYFGLSLTFILSCLVLYHIFGKITTKN